MRDSACGRRARTLGFVALVASAAAVSAGSATAAGSARAGPSAASDDDLTDRVTMAASAPPAGFATASVAGSSGAPLIRILLEDGIERLELRDESDASVHRVAAIDAGMSVDGLPVSAPLRRAGTPVVHVGTWTVRGDVVISRTDRGLRVVNELPIESYLAGTVAAETPASFGAEVLRAQAVAARTYALHQRALSPDAPFHLRATTASQRYRGVDAENEAARTAVEDTAGEALIFEGRPILAVFHSSSGGRTERADEVWSESLPYLREVDVVGEDVSPDTYWRARVGAEAIATALRKSEAVAGRNVGVVTRVTVTDRSPGGRARRVRIDSSRDRVEMTGAALRAAIGESVLRSTLFEVRPSADGDAFVFVGSGRGHGVGMSQWGAFALAQGGAHYRDILSRFYPGTTLERMRRFEP